MILYVVWTGRTACLYRTVQVALTGAAQLRADGISSCCYIANLHNYPSYKEGMAWYSIVVSLRADLEIINS